MGKKCFLILLYNKLNLFCIAETSTMFVSILHTIVPMLRYSGLRRVSSIRRNLSVSYSFSVLDLAKVLLYCISLCILERPKVISHG